MAESDQDKFFKQLVLAMTSPLCTCLCHSPVQGVEAKHVVACCCPHEYLSGCPFCEEE